MNGQVLSDIDAGAVVTSGRTRALESGKNVSLEVSRASSWVNVAVRRGSERSRVCHVVCKKSMYTALGSQTPRVKARPGPDLDRPTCRFYCESVSPSGHEPSDSGFADYSHAGRDWTYVR